MEKILREKDYFKSSDISMISAMQCYGYNIEKIERQNTGKAFFLIEKNEKLGKLIKLFFAHKLKVDPLSYFNFLKETKTRIYNID